MSDVDGTLMPSGKNTRPSVRVIEAIAKANKVIHVGLATSRPPWHLDNVIKHVELSGPSVVAGGAMIIDFPSRKVLWEKTIPNPDALKAARILQNLKVHFLIQGEKEHEDPDKVTDTDKIYKVVAWVPPDHAEEIIDQVSHIPSIAIHKVDSWFPNSIAIVITHAEATKQHGVFQAAKILGIDTKEIIGIGDSYNDFPLLMACGLKVAMGNGVEDIKAIADYIAPSVDEDGLAHVIEKFILSEE